MSHHDARKAGVDILLERNEVDVFEGLERVVYGGDLLVGVGGGVAMSREMLAYCLYVAFFESLGVGGAELADPFGILAKRAESNYGIFRI